MFLFMICSVKLIFKHYKETLNYKWRQFIISCRKDLFSTWLQLTTNNLAVHRQWTLNLQRSFLVFIMLFSGSEAQFLWRAQIGMGSSSPATDLHFIIQMIYDSRPVDTMPTGNWYNTRMKENINGRNYGTMKNYDY